MERDTETLDRLYLEWSQFTSARTKREAAYAKFISDIAVHDNVPKSVQALARNIIKNMNDWN